MIRTDTDRMYKSAQDLIRLSEQMYGVSGDVTRSEQSLTRCSTVVQRASASLHSLERSISELSEHMFRSAHLLKQMAADYEVTERRCMGENLVLGDKKDSSLPFVEPVIKEKVVMVGPGGTPDTPFFRGILLPEFLEVLDSPLNILTSILKGAGDSGDYIDIDQLAGLGLAGNLLEYISNLSKMLGNQTGLEAYQSALTMITTSESVFSGTQSFLSKLVKVGDRGYFDSDWLRPLNTLNMYSNAVGFSNDVLSAYKSYMEYKNGSEKGYNVISEIINAGGSVIDFGGSIYKFQFLSNPRVLHTLTKGGEDATELIVDSSAKSLGAYLLIADAGVSFTKTAVQKWGEYSEDGKIDSNDIAHIGMYSSMHGLNSLAFGVIPDDIVDKGVEKLDNWAVQKGQIGADYILKHKTLNKMFQSGGIGEVTATISGTVLGNLEYGIKKKVERATYGISVIKSAYQHLFQ